MLKMELTGDGPKMYFANIERSVGKPVIGWNQITAKFAII